MQWRSIVSTAALVTLAAVAPARADISERPAVQDFMAEMNTRHGIDRPWLESVFERVELRPDIIKTISRPAESKPWHQYRPIFVTDSRIDQGVAFWRQHEPVLERAQRELGVPPHIIVAILGVETRYGRHTGRHRVADALSTLAFDYPPRSSFFRSELEHFLLMSREEGVDPLALYGSYAGAMGKAQFIPSSFRSYAVDFDGDGRRDLWENVADAVGSIANYFHVHGWLPGEPVAARADVSDADTGGLLIRGLAPRHTVHELERRGVTIAADFKPAAAARLLELEGNQGPEYWATLHNFYVITRYNHSALYAMAVHQLSQAIRERYEEAN